MLRFTKWFIVVALLSISVPFTFAQDDAVDAAPACVAEYDATAEYFADQAEFTFAEGVTVTYYNNYKVVEVLNAYFDAPIFTYVLVQCGTPAPQADDFPDDTWFIEVPVQNIVTLSTTQLPHLVDLDVLDSLVAVDSGFYIYNETIQALIADGVVGEVGGGDFTIDLEAVIDIDPDLVFATGSSPETDTHPVLMDAGVFTALNGEHREATPLGRAEWLKFTALFFNKEAEANALFDAIANEYAELVELASTIPDEERVTVLLNAFSGWTDAWSIPGSETYAGVFLVDANAITILHEETEGGTDSVLFDFETIYDAGLDADVWLTNAYGVNTLDDLLAQDERYADFAAFQNGTVYNNIGRVNANGGSDYYEGAVTAPQVVLADLVAILYPDLLPEHELVYWIPLD